MKTNNFSPSIKFIIFLAVIPLSAAVIAYRYVDNKYVLIYMVAATILTIVFVGAIVLLSLLSKLKESVANKENLDKEIFVRKKTEKELTKHRDHLKQSIEESERKYAAILKHSPVCTKILNKDYILQYISEAGAKTLRMNCDDLCNKSYPFIFFPNNFKHAMLESLDDAKNLKKIIKMEAKIRAADGTDAWFHSTIIPILDNNNDIEYYIIVSVDITDTKRHEQELVARVEEKTKSLKNEIAERELAEFNFESLAVNTQDCIVRYDKNMACIYMNPAALKMFELTKEYVIGRRIIDSPADDSNESRNKTNRSADQWISDIVKVIRSKTASQLRYTWTPDNGEVIYLDLGLYPEINEDNEVMSVICISRNVTKHRINEIAIEEHRDKLKENTANAIKVEERQRRLLAEGIHENVSQLIAIMNMKFKFLSKKISGSSKEELQEIISTGEQALMFSRELTSELAPPSLYEVGLPAAMGTLLEKTKKDYNLEFNLVNNAPHLELDSTLRAAFYQTGRELIHNIVKHASAKTITVTISHHDDKAILEVIDDGVGFDVESDKNSNNNKHGFGLFSINERFNDLGGSVLIDSKPGDGTKIQLFADIG